MKKIMVLILMAFILCSCSKQYKAEHAVSKFIQKYSTNPDSYNPIDFMKVEEYKNKYGQIEYKIGHMYRLVGTDGINRRIIHNFILTQNFYVNLALFEDYENKEFPDH